MLLNKIRASSFLISYIIRDLNNIKLAISITEYWQKNLQTENTFWKYPSFLLLEDQVLGIQSKQYT